jgi:predicted lactoylglutathione lyase
MKLDYFMNTVFQNTPRGNVKYGMEWNEMKLPEEKYWQEIFHDFKQEDIAIKNTSTAVIVSLSLPGTNAAVNNVFSLVNAL